MEHLVEPVSLTLGMVVASLVAKAMDRTDEAVDGGAGVLHRLVGWLREQLGGRDDSGKSALARVEDAPDSPSRLRELAAVVDERASADGEFRTGLEALVAEARSKGVSVGPITQTAWGNQNVQNAGVTDAEITVTYGQPPLGR